MKTKIVVVFFLAGNFLAVPTWASVTFTDNTFNLSNYKYSTFGSNIPFADTVTQSINGGPDGSPALNIVRATVKSNYFERQYFLNNLFTYDPSVSGAVQSISYSQNYLWNGLNSKGNQAIDAAIGSNILIFQNGNYYQYTSSLYTGPGYAGPGVVHPNTWQTGQGNGLTASQFSLISNSSTFGLDLSQHPDFSSGVMTFGMYDGYSVVNSQLFGTESSSWDNLSITVNSVSQVPLPASVWLFGSALLGVLRLKRKMI